MINGMIAYRKTKGGGMTRQAHLVVDLSNGDAGKGTIVDALVRKHHAHTVFRFNGGAQAAHRVVTDDGRSHVFQQFGAGTFVPGVRTILSEFMLVQPWILSVEEKQLQCVGVTDAFDRLFIHERAPIITPFHRAANQMRERSRGDSRHGSCGIGVGETAKDITECGEDLILRMGDICDRELFTAKMHRIRKYKYDQMRLLIAAQRRDPDAEANILALEDLSEVDYWTDKFFASIDQFHIIDDTFVESILHDEGDVVFEGAQGVLIDEWRGFHPYTTWSTCTFQNALALLAKYDGEIHRVGVVRAYATRHGPGPFVTEDKFLAEHLPDVCNKMDPWQQGFRVGFFDCVATRYAIAACGGIDSLAITCLDRLRDEHVWKICTHYELAKEDQGSLLFEEESTMLGLASDICLGPHQDLAYQERLTQALLRTKPVLRITATPGSFETSVEHHIHRITRELDVPVSILSFGPTVNDKKFF
jgi:adenylosuccinate synthase